MDNSIDLQFVEYIVKSLVGNPDAVKIARTIDEKGVLLELTVDPEDLGRVIGKRGATAQSLRTLLRALGTKNDARYNLKIVDNGEPRPPREDRQDDYRSRENDQPDQQNQQNQPEHQEQPAEQETQREDDAPAAAGEDASGSASDDAWSSSVPAPAAPVDDDDDKSSEDDSHSDSISKTRKDLADLDDLDI